MKIGIIDAEIIGKSSHRFPNLACMKLSGYYKELGDEVELLLSYDNLEIYDKVFISKVFVKTELPYEKIDKTLKTEDGVVDFYKDHPILNMDNVSCGGTGFYYDKSPKLSEEIEHHMPDYNLYNEWIDLCIKNGAKEKEFTYYKDYSIGFVTRGCFRQCPFCVNRNYKQCDKHSPLYEFIEKSRPKLCFLDDNFFACKDWREIIKEIKETKKKFQFKQGLDERLLTNEKCEEINSWKYDGDIIFAFDNIEDKDLIIEKLNLLYDTIPLFKKQLKFYVFCGFSRDNVYTEEFWLKDIKDTFERCKILSKYSVFPYIMRHQNAYNSPYEKVYTYLASWTNQPSIFKSFTFEEYCKCHGMTSEGYKKYKRDFNGYLKDIGKKYSSWRSYDDFILKHPEFNKYCKWKPQDVVVFGKWNNYK